MKQAPPSLIDSIKTDYAIKALPNVIAEWNMNRFIGAVPKNYGLTGANNSDPEIFPISSIVENNRPRKGINKARVGHSVVGESYALINGSPQKPRFYVAGFDDNYKYWSSPLKSDSNGNISQCSPGIIYNSNVQVNKIVIGVENSWSSPKTFSIQVTTSATPSEGNWTQIASNSSVGNSWKNTGKIVLWYNGTSWVTTGRVDNTDKTPRLTTIRGVRIVVSSIEGGYELTESGALVQTMYHVGEMSPLGYIPAIATNGSNTFFNLIEIAALREEDISRHIVTVEDLFDLGESSAMQPIGTITSNTGTATLTNLYKNGSGQWVSGLFSADNTESPYKGLIDANCKFTLSYDYYRITKDSTPEEYLGTVRQFEMYAEGWSDQESDQVTVELRDFSKYFDTDEMTPPPVLWEGLTVSVIIAKILDSVGFSDYSIQIGQSLTTDHMIPIFYTDGEQSVWEVLNGLALASQSAIYIDGFGKLRIRTRNFAFSPSNAPVWNFTSDGNTLHLSDIVDAEKGTEFEPNRYKVMYQNTNWSDWNRGLPSMQTVWSPTEESVVLRAAPLFKDLGAADTQLFIPATEANIWPYSSKINIDGEIIEYTGKKFVYYTGSTATTRNEIFVNNEDEFKEYNELTPDGYRDKNHFTGALKISKRGVWNSVPVDHKLLGPFPYENRRVLDNTHSSSGNQDVIRDPLRSRIQLVTPGGFNDHFDYLITRTFPTGEPYFTHWGTRFRFLKDDSRPMQTGGMVINASPVTSDAYYIELTPTSNLDGDSRAWRGEVLLSIRKGGTWSINRFSAFPIAENVDYEVDVWMEDYADGRNNLYIWINGKLVLESLVPIDRVVPKTTGVGAYLKGSGRAEFEYLYGLKQEGGRDMPEDFSFLDKVQRGYVGGQWDRNWTYRWSDYEQWRVRNEPWGFAQQKFNFPYIDDFGPFVHEIREFDVKFDPKPVLHSRLFSTNDFGATILEYKGNPFGAKFIIANTSRGNVIVNGEDKVSFPGTDATKNQILSVYGRALVVSEGTEIISENLDQIRIRGKIESEMSNNWIQSESMAKDLADWMNNRFSYGNEFITLDVFGNPLIEVGDVVSVDFPEKHISGDWFVISATTKFEEGIQTSLGLRKRIN